MSAARSGMFRQSYTNQAYALIGGHFPYDAYIGGLPLIGQLWNLFRKDGRGLDRIVMQAADVAAKPENGGLAWWRFGPLTDAVLVVRPDDIQAIKGEHNNCLIQHDSTGSFDLFFGPGNIFSLPGDSKEWRETRNQFLHLLFAEQALRGDVAPMQAVVTKHLDRLTQAGAVSDIEQFCTSLTMDMIGLKLGMTNVSEENKRRTGNMILEGAVEVANPWNQVIAPYIPGYDFKKTRLYQILQEGRVILRNMVHECQDSLDKMPAWIGDDNLLASEEIPDKTFYGIIQFLIVGHETTAKLLLMSVLLLADTQHRDILERLRQEIAQQSLPPEQWTRETIKHLPYMEAFINEVLRLYPPIPDRVFKVKTGFSIADGNANFKPGDLAVISPRVTGWSNDVWGEDAAEFKPERFVGINTRDIKYKHFPFGFQPRQCVGQNFSRQEVALTLARLVTQFDLHLENKDGHELHHPFPFHQIFTMRFGLDNVGMRFEPRANAANRPTCGV